MTDMEKLTNVLEKLEIVYCHKIGKPTVVPGYRGYLGNVSRDFDLTFSQLHGLIEGTHVVVPVEPTYKMRSAGHGAVSFVADAGSFRIMAIESYKAMLKAAQE
jgi:hypothetical protein